MKSFDRVMTSLSHKESDKVPIFLFLTVHGADAVGKSFSEFYSDDGSNLAKAQLRLQEKFGHDCLYSFFYAAVEYEAFGGTAMVKSEGPPESGKPLFNSADELLSSELPTPNHESFAKVVKAQKILFEAKGAELPIINAVVAPLSLSIMLMGFENWIECITTQPEVARNVVKHLSDYTVSLANYLFENHATAVAYFNPLASPQMMSLEEFEKISLDSCIDYFKRIKGASVYALAGGKSEALMELLIEKVHPAGVTISRNDDLGEMKKKWGHQMNLVGNLDNIGLQFLSLNEIDEEVKRCVEEGAKDGGFILSDHHADLPLHLSDDSLRQLVKSRDKWGLYA